jgi:hypothetical protein
MQVSATLTVDAIAKLKLNDKEGKHTYLNDKGESCTIEYNFGDSIDEMVAIFSEEVVTQMVIGHILFTLQGKMRSWLAAGKDEEEIQELLFDVDSNTHNWKPTLGGTRKSEEEKLETKLSKLSVPQRAAQIKAMQELLARMQQE